MIYAGDPPMKRRLKTVTKSKKYLQLIVIIAGAGMLCYGMVRGETAIVFAKAIKICLECIGIG